MRRLLRQLKRRGDEVVAHALRGLPSNRKISADTEQEAVEILSQPVYRGFGPTLASEYLAKKHDIEVSRETVRQWMIGAKLWKARKQRVEKIHEWRPRRSRFGELVQWDTSPHDWLEGRGEEILLINMIDDATSRWFARFVVSDSTVENMNLLERYLKKHKRPLAFYTDKAAIFQTAEKTKRDGSRLGKSREEPPPTQEKHHDLAAILSHVEKRRVNANYTFPLGAKIYRILRQDISAGLRGAYIRVDQRRDGSVAACFGGRYLRVERCEQRPKVTPQPAQTTAPRKPARGSA